MALTPHPSQGQANTQSASKPPNMIILGSNKKIKQGEVTEKLRPRETEVIRKKAENTTWTMSRPRRVREKREKGRRRREREETQVEKPQEKLHQRNLETPKPWKRCPQ